MLAKQSSGAVLDLRDHLTPTGSRPGTGDINADCAVKLPAAEFAELCCGCELRKPGHSLALGHFAHRLPASLLPNSSRLGLWLRSFVFCFFIFSQPTKTTSC